VLSLVRFDNKRGYVTPRADEVPMILLEGLGRVRMSRGSELTPVPLAVIARAIARIPRLRAAA
jgi:hypothetical protein